MGLHLIAAALRLAVAGLGPSQDLAEAPPVAAEPSIVLFGDAVLVAYGDGQRIRLQVLGDVASTPVPQGLEPQVRPGLAVGPLGELLISYYTPDPDAASQWALWVVAREAGAFGAPQRVATRLPGTGPQTLVLRSRGGVSIAWEQTGPPGESGVYVDGTPMAFIHRAREPRLAEDAAGFLIVAYLRDGQVLYRSERDDAALGIERAVPLPMEATDISIAVDSSGALHFLCTTLAELQHVITGDPQAVAGVPGTGGATGGRLALLPDGTLGIAFLRAGRLQFVTRRSSTFGPVEPVPDSAGARSLALGAGVPVGGAGAGYFLAVFDTEQKVSFASDAAPPSASFRASAMTVSQGEEVAFEDLSTGAIFDRLWDFGDGVTFRGAQPKHRYGRPGVYRVQLRVIGPGGTSSYLLDPLRVLPADNLLRFPDVTARPGDGGLRIPALLTSTESISGFQAVFRVTAPLEAGELLLQGTRTAYLEPELLSVERTAEDGGVVIEVAALWDYLFPFDGRLLAPGKDLAIFICELSVPATTAPGSAFPVRFLDRYGPQERSSIVVTAGGQSLVPFVVDGAVSIVAEAGYPFVRGDANGDRHVDISDAIWILAYLFLGEREAACHDAADKNDDGILDVSDPIDLLQYLFAGGLSYPAYPYPVPGFDGTIDPLPICEGP